MRLAPGIGALAITFALGVAGLFATGVAGSVAGFVWLGVFPGMALARLLVPGAPAITRWTLGVSLSPLATSLAGAALVQSGQSVTDAARIVGVGGWLLFAGGEARALATRGRSDADAPADRGTAVWIAAAGALAVIPFWVSPHLWARADAWVHAGRVSEILERGIPPLDPRFAELSPDHGWFHALFITLASSIRSEPQPFVTLAVASVTWMAAQATLAWQLAWAVWRDRAAARAAVPTYLLWLHAGTLVQWSQGLVGSLRGVEVTSRMAGASWDRTPGMHDLGAPLRLPAHSLDAFSIGSAFDYAWLMLMLWWWAVARWLGEARETRSGGAPPAWRWLAVAAAAAAGMLLFHRVVGLSAVSVGVGSALVLAVLARTRWRVVEARRALAFAGVSAVGLAVSLPYSLGLLHGWQGEAAGLRLEDFRLERPMPWTLLAACGVTLLVASPSLRRVFSERRSAGVWLALWAAGMGVLALVVRRPEWNTSRCWWPVFAPLAILSGASLAGAWSAWRARLGKPAALVLCLFVLGAPRFPHGAVSDPGEILVRHERL